LAKRLTDKEKREITDDFTAGKTLEELAENFNCTKLTICRNLKKKLGEEKYENLIKKNKLGKFASIKGKNESQKLEKETSSISNFSNKNRLNNNEESIASNSFFEIAPLNCEIDNLPQKDLSSIPISEVDLPKIVYLVVDKNIELEIKLLKDYPDWQFLSNTELNRKTIEIYFDLKVARKQSTKEQKVIKVPNPDVFRIVAPILISKGISRIVTCNNLISL
tara:strand:- start:131 stop:793 length:663 start_codon:yes stop_codon:yes gene_type:complete